MEDEVLIANQNHFKDFNNEQIANSEFRIADLQQQIVSYGQSITDNETEIRSLQEKIVKLQASNLAIDETIRIIETN